LRLLQLIREKICENSNFKPLQIALLTVGLLLNFWAYFHFKIDSDATQLFQKGYTFFKDSTIIFYGSRATEVGFVPGGLLSVLAGFPLKIVNNPIAPMTLILLSQLGAYFLIDSILKKHGRTAHRGWWLLLFWLNPWRLLTSYLWNPAYLFFYSALHFWSADKMSEEKHFGYTLLHCCAIGLALQTHLSFILLGLISVFLLCYRKLKLHLGAVVCFGVLLLGTLVPYFYMLMQDTEHGISKTDRIFIGFGLLKVYPFLKGVLYWLRYNSFLFPSSTFALNTAWLGTGGFALFVSKIWVSIIYIIGGLSMVPVIYCQYYFIKKLKVPKNINVYVKSAFFALLTVSAITPILFSHWYLYLIFIPAQMTVIFSLVKYFECHPIRSKKTYRFITFYFVLFNIIAVLGSQYFSIDQNVSKQYQHLIKNGEITSLHSK